MLGLTRFNNKRYNEVNRNQYGSAKSIHGLFESDTKHLAGIESLPLTNFCPKVTAKRFHGGLHSKKQIITK